MDTFEKRLQRKPKIITYGVKMIYNFLLQNPGVPYSVNSLYQRFSLTRNDSINVRRFLNNIHDMEGPVRFLEPDRSHVVFLPKEVLSKQQVRLHLCSCAAMLAIQHSHIRMNQEMVAQFLEQLTHDIQKNPTLSPV